MKMVGNVLNDPKALVRKEIEIQQAKAYIRKELNKANKRIKRLERNGMQETAAYSRYIADSGKFGIKGKTHIEVLAEAKRLQNFLDAKTSTVRGAQKVLKKMASSLNIPNTKEGMEYIKHNAPLIFRLGKKLEEYQLVASQSAAAFDSKQRFEDIGNYLQSEKVDTGELETDMDRLVQEIDKRMNEINKPITTTGIYIK